MLTKFEENLEEIKEKIVTIGIKLVSANQLILQAIKNCESEKLNEAKQHLKNIGAKADDIDNHIIKVLALYTPEARDLRQVIAYLKVTNELSRACSNTRSFIRGFGDVCADVESQTIHEYAAPMQEATTKAVELSISMLEIDDEDDLKDIYNEVHIQESKTDDLYEMLERQIALQAEGINNFDKYNKILRAFRKSEKIASRATSIANLMVYVRVGGNFHS